MRTLGALLLMALGGFGIIVGIPFVLGYLAHVWEYWFMVGWGVLG